MREAQTACMTTATIVIKPVNLAAKREHSAVTLSNSAITAKKIAMM
jgi:hypothetical protein